MPDSEPGRRFQRLVARLDYPMHVVTTRAGDDLAGCLVGFATQCSIHPPRYLVFISVRNRTYAVMEHASAAVVHLLGHDDAAVAEWFGGVSGDDVDKFAGIQWHAGRDGVPVLEDVDSWFEARVVGRVDVGGDHVGFLLEPVDAAVGDDPDLGYQDVRDIDPGHRPSGP